jgi:hypothetical protein
MRVALLASAILLLSGAPAFAQCIYVTCNGGVQAAAGGQQPSHQPPAHQIPVPNPPARHTSSYDEGFAAGLAARSPTRATTHKRRAPAASTRTTTSTTQHIGRRTGVSAKTGASRAVAARSHPASGATRRTSAARHVAHGRATPPRAPVHHANHGPHSFTDSIKDRAATYRSAAFGQSTSMASLMTQSSSFNSTTTWSGPVSVVRQGGQVCGWGTRIVTHSQGPSQGPSQRQAVWVCQCPQGWRPPGY